MLHMGNICCPDKNFQGKQKEQNLMNSGILSTAEREVAQWGKETFPDGST